MDMKKLIIAVVLIVGVTFFALYWFGYLTAVDCSGATEKTKLDCDFITTGENKCKEACPTRDQWNKYATEKKASCQETCELMEWEGASAEDIAACKKRCAQQYQNDMNSYKDKAQCETGCSKEAQAEQGTLFRFQSSE